MNKSIKLTDNQKQMIIELYKDYQIEDTSTLYEYVFKKDGINILLYKNATLLLQGKDENVNEEYFLITNLLNIKDENKVEDNNNSNVDLKENDNLTHMGSDEVGCGDYLAPIVVCACLILKKDYEYLKSLNIKDSKQLSDEQIKDIASKIANKVSSSCVVLSNKKYNELHDEKKYNLNEIKAFLHNFALLELIKKTKHSGLIVIDQFCDQNLYYKYLIKQNCKIVNDIYFTTKAENKYLAVACASILARNAFLIQVEKIEKQLGYKIPLGAGSNVDQFVSKIVEEKGFEFIKDYCKFHYKNTKKILKID